MTLRIACIGRNGQTALALAAVAARDPDIEIIPAGRETLDLRDPASLEAFLTSSKPQAVINAAAYNAVDRAESEPDQAFAINAEGPRAIAGFCRQRDIPFIHMSTDCVFDGTKPSAYTEDDAPNPLSVYGRSKRAGEIAVLEEDPTALVTRVCWVFSEHGENFVSRIIDLARTRPTLRVVSDQIGPPTHAGDLASALIAAASMRAGDPKRLSGVLHLASGETTSRTDMADAIMAASRAQGGPSAVIEPILTADYATPARRPLNAQLSSARADARLGLSWRPWRDAIPPAVAAVLARTR